MTLSGKCAFVYHKLLLIEDFEDEADDWLEKAEKLIVDGPGGIPAMNKATLCYGMVWSCDEALIELQKAKTHEELGQVVDWLFGKVERCIADCKRCDD